MTTIFEQAAIVAHQYAVEGYGLSPDSITKIEIGNSDAIGDINSAHLNVSVDVIALVDGAPTRHSVPIVIPLTPNIEQAHVDMECATDPYFLFDAVTPDGQD